MTTNQLRKISNSDHFVDFSGSGIIYIILHHNNTIYCFCCSVVTVGILILLGWQLNILESVVITLAIGLRFVCFNIFFFTIFKVLFCNDHHHHNQLPLLICHHIGYQSWVCHFELSSSI